MPWASLLGSQAQVLRCLDQWWLLQVALHQQGQAAALFKEALLDSPDDWVSLQHYLDCILTQTTQVAGDESGPHGAEDGSGPQGAKDHDEVNHGLLQVHDHHQVHDKHTLAFLTTLSFHLRSQEPCPFTYQVLISGPSDSSVTPVPVLLLKSA